MPLLVTPRDPAARFLTHLRRPLRGRGPLWPSLLRGGISGFLAAGAVTGWNMAFCDNLHEIQPGRTFRSSQMSPDHLRRALDRYHIRTVVNLRGTCTEFAWYDAESRATLDADVAQEDVFLSATRLPSPTELRRLMEVLDRTEYPILLHCRQGVDRTGLAAALVKLLEPGVSMAEARRQLGLGYGYVPFNGTEAMLEFLDLYEEWLAGQKLVHSPELLRHWAQREYCPGPCRGRLETLGDFPTSPLPANQSRTCHVRVHNSSVRTWRLTTAALQGFHLRYCVVGSDGQPVFSERAGLFDAIVPPGEAIDLIVGLPALPVGAYLLRIDMVDENQNAFCQFGIEPFIWEFNVRP
jgi:protein tyrosine phosphatase (PTP) superfamily phosphohydrolase (DUF442 family)